MSIQTTVRWITDRHFVGIDSDNHSVVLSGQQDAIGVKPSQMLLIALASCSSVDVVEIMAKKRKPLKMLEVIATGMSGDGLTEKAVNQAITLSQEKYCSVAATVRGVAEITTEFEIVD